MGFDGMDLCRQAPIIFTGWVGADRILDFVCELHVSVLTVAALAIILVSMMAFA